MTIEASTAYREPEIRAADEIEQAVGAGNWPRANEIANRAISRGLRHPIFFMIRAQRMEESGHPLFALEDYQRAAAIAPSDARIHEAVGFCAMQLENYKLAAESYGRAIEVDPRSPETHYRRGVALAHVGDHEGAQRAHEKAVDLDPQYAEALASLASIMSRKGELEAARDFAERALAADPEQTTAMMALAQADMSQRRYADAEARLKKMLSLNILTPLGRPPAISMLGDALDAQKKYAEAFAAYATGNQELRRLNEEKFAGNIGVEAARNLIVYFENERPERWLANDDSEALPDDFSGHVFLMGFMRSGTTLLEQVLASNPNITALEEKGLLIAPGEEYLLSVPALNSLANIESADLIRLRRRYWKRVREYLPDAKGQIFVDKQPLNTTKLPLIAKMFPKARILFAIRDPRDVVFSCFRRHFRVTATQFEFLSIDSCARIYSLIMRLGEVCREKLPLTVYEHRYESMVEDFDGRIRDVCEFIGVEWAETMRNFDQHASVADLRSPSATQVRRPLYGEGIGQWRRYSEQLKPILPVLEPWVEKFGYPRD